MNKLKTTGKKCHTQDTEPEKNENEKRDEKELREKKQRRNNNTRFGVLFTEHFPSTVYK